MFKKLSQLKKYHQLVWSLIIAVAMVSLWRGIWRLFDVYLFPGDPMLSSGASVIIGVSLIAITHHRLG